MTMITAVIAEDEIHLQTSLIHLLNQIWPELAITGTASNGIEAVSLIEQAKPDVVFLDIQMPGLSGLQVANRMAGLSKIVFITAYDQYAVQAFEHEAADYILKPVTRKRLEKTIQRLKNQFSARPSGFEDKAGIEKILKILAHHLPKSYLKLVKVKTGSQLQFIPVSQILYFKASDKYTIVQTPQKEHLINTPIKVLETRLDPEQFWRVHRNAIVNVHKIDRIHRSFTNQMLIGFGQIDHKIAVSRAFEHLFR